MNILHLKYAVSIAECGSINKAAEEIHVAQPNLSRMMKDLEAESLDAVEIIMAIEEEYGIEIPDEEAEKFQKVSDLVDFVEEKSK